MAFAGGVPGFAIAEEAAAEAPRIVAALEQGSAAESGRGGFRHLNFALVRYCDAGALGSTEGFFRLGRLLRQQGSARFNAAMGNAYLALAARLGHLQAQIQHDPALPDVTLPDDCNDFFQRLSEDAFDIEAFIAAMPASKRKIVELMRKEAQRSEIDFRFVLAVGLAESNLNAQAVSPKNAQGVMQLIPETQARFRVTRPFDPASNIRGALAYIRWLAKRFDQDPVRVAAAYNAGEGAVERYKGVPPYAETRAYVRRVMYFSGYTHLLKP